MNDSYTGKCIITNTTSNSVGTGHQVGRLIPISSDPVASDH